MAALTTGEEIGKQLSVIFGYRGAENLNAGYILGTGRLTSEGIRALITKALDYLDAYNGLLRDYIGADIYSVEYSLKCINRNISPDRILPAAMLFVPGEFKERYFMVLALTGEKGVFNIDKAKPLLIMKGKRLFEVEELVNGSGLDSDTKRTVLEKFAERFAYKIEGELIEGNWHRKLIGLKEISSEHPDFIKILDFKCRYFTEWSRNRRIIRPYTVTYSSIRPSIPEELRFEFLKWTLYGPPVYEIISRLFEFSAELLEIANTGSMDFFRRNILSFLLEQLKGTLLHAEKVAMNDVRRDIDKLIAVNGKYIDIINSVAVKFAHSGKIFGSVDELVDGLSELIFSAESDNPAYCKLGDEFIKYLKNTAPRARGRIRAIELEPYIQYFTEMCKSTLALFRSAVEGYRVYLMGVKLLDNWEMFLRERISSESDPLIRHLYGFIIDEIISRLKSVFIGVIAEDGFKPVGNQINPIRRYLVSKLRDLMELIVKNMNIEPRSIIDALSGYFTETTGDSDAEELLNLSLNFLMSVKFLMSFFFRSNTFNRFIREYNPEENGSDFKIFAETFAEFMRKRIAGIPIEFKEFALQIIGETGDKLGTLYKDDDRCADPYFIASEFTESFIKTLKNFTEIEGLIDIIKKGYLPGIGDKKSVTAVVEILEKAVRIIEGASKRIMGWLNVFTDTVNGSLPASELSLPVYLIIESGGGSNPPSDKNIMSFSEFTVEYYIKNYPYIVAFPSTMLLVSENSEFKAPLLYRLDFKFFENFFRVSVYTNWLRVRKTFFD